MNTLYYYIKFINSNGLINLMLNPELRKYDEGVYNKWKALGFFLPLNETDGIILSNIFEFLSNFLLKNEQSIDSIIFFAIARRLYDNYHVVLSTQELVSEVNKYFPKFTEEDKKYFRKQFGIDIEAEACLQTSKIIGRNFRKRI